MSDMAYQDGGSHAPPVGGVRIYPPAPVCTCLLQQVLVVFSKLMV